MESTAEEISLGDIAQTLWSRRLLILLTTLGMGFAALATAFLLPEKFESTVVLAPVGEESGASKLGGAGALLSQFGGLGALGGLSLGGGGRKAEAIATLGSAALAEGFIRDNALLPMLYPKQWDADKKDWKSSDPDERPTIWKAEQMFAKKIRSVSEDKKTGLITLTITWKDPVQAASWATDMVARANATLRKRSIEQSERNLSYLNDQLTKTSVVDLQKAIYGLIENEIKQVMIAKGSEEFALRVLDPARISEKRSSPKRALIIFLGLAAGLVMAAIIAILLPSRLR